MFVVLHMASRAEADQIMWMMTAGLGPSGDVSRLNADAAATPQALIPSFCAKMVHNGLWRIRAGIRLVSPSSPQMLVDTAPTVPKRPCP